MKEEVKLTLPVYINSALLMLVAYEMVCDQENADVSNVLTAENINWFLDEIRQTMDEYLRDDVLENVNFTIVNKNVEVG